MKQVYSDVIQFRGSHYDFGYMQGKDLLNSPILPNRAKQWGSRRNRHSIIDVDTYKSVIMTYSKGIWEEIQGLADALELDMNEAVREFGGYYLEYGKSGCSIFSGSNYFVRNYDNEPLTYEGRFVFYEPTDGGYATVGPSMQITGRSDGINEKGLVMGYNFVNRKQSDHGFVCNMIGRLVLENCADVDEAIVFLKELPHRHSFNYVLSDLRGESYVVEASPRRVEVRKGFYCTNHFDLLTEENRYQMDDSLSRTEVMETATKNDAPEAVDAFRLLNDPDQGVFSNKYGAWAGTIHTAAYFPKDLQVWFSLGGNQNPVIFNFNKWLQGENTIIKQIKGNLDSKTGFINRKYL